MVYHVSTRDLPRQVLVTMRHHVPQGQLARFVGHAFNDIFEQLPSLRAQPVGPPFLIYHQADWDGVDAEACVPVDHTDPPTEPLSAHIQPSGRFAQTLHVGPHGHLRFAYEALSTWVAERGYRQAGPVRECYLRGPAEGLDESQYHTQIEMLIEPCGVPVGTASSD